MKNNLNKMLSVFLEKKELLDLCLINTNEGIIICTHRLEVLFLNRKAYDMLNIEVENTPSNLEKIFSSDDIDTILNSKNFIYNEIINIRLISFDTYHCFFMNDISKEIKLQEELEKAKQMNKELQFMLEQYSDDTIYITDKNGKTLYAGEGVAQNCGVKSSDLIGKNVADLERKGIFDPSVTLKVLESKQSEVVIQNTFGNQRVLSVGTPIFNSDDELTKVVSISRDLSNPINMGKLISKMDDEKESVQEGFGFYPSFITCSPRLYDVVELIKLVSPVNSTVLICGETGTGKDVIANLIHQLSPRSKKQFIRVNCGAIAPNLVESELFGYEAGAFTGAKREGKIGLIEAANGGTLFLDEISELPLSQQVKLLQVLQERKMIRVGGTKDITIDIRFIAASNRDLDKMVAEGQFREDLFYRLNVVPISIPPLGDRKEDIPLLAKHFLKKCNINYKKSKVLSKEVVDCFSAYHWPGNVRELEHIIERLVVTSKGPIIGTNDLPDYIRKIKEDSLNGKHVFINDIIPLNLAIEETEKKLIKMALEKYKTTQKVAEVLNVNQSTISRKVRRYKLTTKMR